MRLFVGIDLDPALAAAIDRDVTALRATLDRTCPRLPARWVPRANLHLTLVFIGHVPDDDAPDLMSAIAAPIDAPKFDLSIGGFGTFPPSGTLRVIWMGVGSGARELSDLHDETVARLAAAGRSAETRAYSPHLTVARVKDAHGPLARTAREAAGKAAPRGGVSRVDELTVFRSRPSAAGSVYERLLRIPLRA